MIGGIDPDTKFICLSAGDNFYTAIDKARLATARFLPLMSQFRMLLLNPELRELAWVYVERPPMGVNPKATIDQAKVVGGLETLLHERGIPFSEVDPGTWKKGLIGQGNADKELIRSWAIINLGLPEGLRQDFYDSACIRRWGELSYGGSTPLVSGGTNV